MNNLKKIGVTALAGSLMSLSVSAGEMAVTGTAEITYTTNDSTGTGATSVGNPFGMKNNITFKGSGDVIQPLSIFSLFFHLLLTKLE